MEQKYIRIGGLATTAEKEGVIPASPATIWRKVKDGTFPKPVKLGERITAWKIEDVNAWLATRHEEAAK